MLWNLKIKVKKRFLAKIETLILQFFIPNQPHRMRYVSPSPPPPEF